MTSAYPGEPFSHPLSADAPCSPLRLPGAQDTEPDQVGITGSQRAGARAGLEGGLPRVSVSLPEKTGTGLLFELHTHTLLHFVVCEVIIHCFLVIKKY